MTQMRIGGCLACAGAIVTDTQYVVCVVCRSKGLRSVDDVNTLQRQLDISRKAAKAYHDELNELEVYDCPACRVQISPDNAAHDPECALAATLELPLNNNAPTNAQELADLRAAVRQLQKQAENVEKAQHFRIVKVTYEPVPFVFKDIPEDR